MNSHALSVAYILHDDASYLAASLHSFQAVGEVFAFVSRVPWLGALWDWQASAPVAGRPSMKRSEQVAGAVTTLVWDGSDYVQGRA